METIPELVQELNLRGTTNSVCVATVKFTLDQLDGNIDYLRKHAMAKGSSGDEPEPTPDGGSDVTPVVPEA